MRVLSVIRDDLAGSDKLIDKSKSKWDVEEEDPSITWYGYGNMYTKAHLVNLKQTHLSKPTCHGTPSFKQFHKPSSLYETIT